MYLPLFLSLCISLSLSSYLHLSFLVLLTSKDVLKLEDQIPEPFQIPLLALQTVLNSKQKDAKQLAEKMAGSTSTCTKDTLYMLSKVAALRKSSVEVVQQIDYVLELKACIDGSKVSFATFVAIIETTESPTKQTSGTHVKRTTSKQNVLHFIPDDSYTV